MYHFRFIYHFHFIAFLFCFCKSSIEMDIWSSLFFTSIHYFCGYSLISHYFKMVDSVSLNWYFHLIFFLHMKTMFSSVVKISGLCLFPNGGHDIQSFLPLLIIHQGAVPSASRPSYCQAGYDSDVIWKKSTEKKVSPPSSTKAHPIR